MARDLSFDLHHLTARLDRAADRILQAELHLTYRRFLALLVLGQLDNPTQRELAEALDITEPSVSRMVAVLATSGLLAVEPDPGGGRRNRLTLSADGEAAVRSARHLLEASFTSLVQRSGVAYERYADDTRRLIEALDSIPSSDPPQSTHPAQPTRPSHVPHHA